MSDLWTGIIAGAVVTFVVGIAVNLLTGRVQDYINRGVVGYRGRRRTAVMKEYRRLKGIRDGGHEHLYFMRGIVLLIGLYGACAALATLELVTVIMSGFHFVGDDTTQLSSPVVWLVVFAFVSSLSAFLAATTVTMRMSREALVLRKFEEYERKVMKQVETWEADAKRGRPVVPEAGQGS